MLPDDAVVKGRLFRAARALLHWNQAQLASRSGLSVGTLNGLRTHGTVPRPPPLRWWPAPSSGPAFSSPA
jgi:hypothetical protein